MFKITTSFKRMALMMVLAISGTLSVLAGNRLVLNDGGLYLLDTIYICIKFIGAPIVVPLFAFLPSNLPFSIRFLNQEFASKESKSVCGYQSFRMRWLMCG